MRLWGSLKVPYRKTGEWQEADPQARLLRNKPGLWGDLDLGERSDGASGVSQPCLCGPGSGLPSMGMTQGLRGWGTSLSFLASVFTILSTVTNNWIHHEKAHSGLWQEGTQGGCSGISHQRELPTGVRPHTQNTPCPALPPATAYPKRTYFPIPGPCHNRNPESQSPAPG